MTALSTLLSNPDKVISYILEFSDSTGATHRFQTPNRGDETTEGFPSYLINPGSRSDKMEADELSSIVSASSSPFILSNPRSSVAGDRPLDILKNRSISNRPFTLYAGAGKQPDGTVAEPFANYEPVMSGVIDKEPLFQTDIVEIRSKSALDRLNSDLEVGSYIGEPAALKALTSTATAATSYNSVYDLNEFTIAGRIWVDSFGASGASSFGPLQKVSGANVNFRVQVRRVELAIRVDVSSGGVTIRNWQGGSLVTRRWYDFVFGFRSGYQYLMVDGIIVDEFNSTSTPDKPAVGLTLNPSGASGLGRYCDIRVYNHFISADDMRSEMSNRVTVIDSGMIGLWRGDDYTGNTLTDHSSTAAHATIAGTEEVDFEWASSGLGTEQLAGKSMPALIGSVFHAPADLVDPTLEVWRVNDRLIDAWISNIVRDEGEELSSSTDYDLTPGEELISLLVSEAGEPLTLGIEYVSGDSQIDKVLGGHPTSEYGSILVDRGPLSNNDLDITGLHSLFPNDLGIYTRRTGLTELVRSILHGMGAHAYNNINGKLSLDALVPPTSPGPRNESCVEIISSEHEVSGIEWVSGTAILNSESFTLAGWFKLHRSWNSDDPKGDIPLVRLYDGGNNELRWNIDTSNGQPRMELEFYFSASIQKQSGASFLSDDPIGEWWFLAVSNTSGGSVRFYAAALGDTLRLVGSASALAYSPFPLPAYNTVQIGGDLSPLQVYYPFFRGGVAEPRVWNIVRSLSALQAYMTNTSPTHTGRTFSAPVNGTSTVSLTDIVTGTVGTITNRVVQRPDLVVDLNNTPMKFTTGKIRPADRIEVRFRKNYHKLSPSEIVATVPDDDNLDLQQDSRSVPYDNPSISGSLTDANLDPRQITLDSPWYTAVGASGTLRLIKYRLADGREVADLIHDTTEQASVFERQLMVRQIGDEIKVIDDQGDEYTFRLIGNEYKFVDYTANVGLFR